MEFFSIYLFHLFFVYGVCRLDGKAFFIWPYALYILIYVAVFWAYLCFVRFLLKAIKAVFVIIKNDLVRVIPFCFSKIKKPESKAEEPRDEEKSVEDEENPLDSTQ